MRTFMEQVERLLTAGVLFLIGGFIACGGLSALSWGSAVTAVLVLPVIRPLTGWIAQLRGRTTPGERAVTSFFGIQEELWAVVTFTDLLSVMLHGAAASPVLRRLDRTGYG